LCHCTLSGLSLSKGIGRAAVANSKGRAGCDSSLLARVKWAMLHLLSPEAEAYFTKKGCKVLLQPTPEAIHMFNKSHAKKIGLFHVTC
jgi:hypothetical protein